MNDPVNSLGLAYINTTGVEAYAHPGMAVITGRGNRYDSAFQNVIDNGGEAYAYINFCEVPLPANQTSDVDKQFYANAKQWPYPDSTGALRVSSTGNMLADVRINSDWSKQVVQLHYDLMMENDFSGALEDIAGDRLWSAPAAWLTWSLAEQEAYIFGVLDILRQIDEMRRSIFPQFKIVNNNTLSSQYAAQFRSRLDGSCLEHHAYTETANAAYAALQYSNLGHKRFFVIARGKADAQGWQNIPGVTHISYQFDATGKTNPYASVSAYPPLLPSQQINFCN